MPGKSEQYQNDLKTSADWVSYLRTNSGLPGPRGNLELAQAVAVIAAREQLDNLLVIDESHPVENTPDAFVVFCAIKGMGKFAADDPSVRSLLRSYAADPRWRIREAVAMALQLWGEQSMDEVLLELESWPLTNPLEMRAIAAGICEPALLKDPSHEKRVLSLMDRVTTAFLAFDNRKSDDVRTLRQGLAYCWSVAVAAYPHDGKLLMEKWLNHTDVDIQWIMRENLKKNRLLKMDAAWVAKFI